MCACCCTCCTAMCGNWEPAEDDNTYPLLGTACSAQKASDDEVFVLVFTGGDSAEQSLEPRVPDKEPHDPDKAARAIFPHLEDASQLDGNGQPFRQRVKTALGKLLELYKIDKREFDSIDQDVTFWVLSATKDRLKVLATEYNYVMPLNHEAYQMMEQEIPVIEDDIKVHAHVAYADGDQYGGHEFRGIDRIRLVSLALSGVLNMNELVKHKVIQRWFPVAGYDEMVDLTAQVVGVCKTTTKEADGKKEVRYFPRSFFPKGRDVDALRSYFGEEIACFFGFYGFLLKAMLFPAMFAAIVFAIDMLRPFNITRIGVNTYRAVFAGAIMCWGAWVCAKAEHSVARDRLRWGMDGNRSADVVLPDYVPPEDVSPCWLRFKLRVGDVVTALFLFSVVAVCCFSAAHFSDETQSMYAQTIITLLFSVLWSKLAHLIVTKLENRRTQAKLNKSLTMRLFFVKLFIFFFPLMRLAFFAPVAEKVCVNRPNPHDASGRSMGNSTDDILRHFFSQMTNQHEMAERGISATSHGFREYMDSKNKIDRGNPLLYVVSVVSDRKVLLGMLSSRDGPDEQIVPECYRGCFPMVCEETRIGVSCWDTCYNKLKNNLITLFISHAGLTLCFVLYPMVQVKRKVAAEKYIAEGLAKRNTEKDSRKDMETQPLNNKPQTPQQYTLIEFQEKCHQIAAYEYGSWGGSYVEDFLEVVLSFAQLVCFAVVSPTMAMFGFVAAVVEYRLLAFRMLWVTCRPFPSQSDGLNEWLSILDAVLFIATGMNSLLLVTVLHTDLDLLRPSLKLLSVFLATLGFITVRVVMRILLQEQPQDIINADDVNHMFLSDLRMKVRKETSVVLKSPEQNQDEPENVEQDADDGIMGLVSGRSWTSVSRIRLRGFGLFR
mmetsp:Transcript_8617/g.24774  ORF Transcript_8617/g.24774 Transcript_8617/m.24774 type:complete len:886 (+) Transcript_8617:84-2741(+)